MLWALPGWPVEACWSRDGRRFAVVCAVPHWEYENYNELFVFDLPKDFK